MIHLQITARVISPIIICFIGYSFCLETKGKCGDKCCNNYRRNGYDTCEECPFGTFGYQCTEECPENYYGRFCVNRCICSTGQRCHKMFGCIKYEESDKGSVGKDNFLLVGVSVGVAVVMAVVLIVCMKFLKQRACLKECYSTVDNGVTTVQMPEEENVTQSRYLNLDCLNNDLRHASLPVPDVVTTCTVPVQSERQSSLIGREENNDNSNPMTRSDSNRESQKLQATDSGEYIKMRSGQHSQDPNNPKSNSASNEKSVYEDMSLIRSCKNKLSSFFRRRHNRRSRKVSKLFKTRYSVEMLEARNTFLPMQESELSTMLENTCIEENRYEEAILGGESNSETSIGMLSGNQDPNKFPEENEGQESQSMDSPYEICQCSSILDSNDNEPESVTEIHSQTHRPATRYHRTSYLGNGNVDEASYEEPWENNLAVHVQEYKEVAMELQRNTLSGEFVPHTEW